jgi:hypothetical protein
MSKFQFRVKITYHQITSSLVDARGGARCEKDCYRIDHQMLTTEGKTLHRTRRFRTAPPIQKAKLPKPSPVRPRFKIN